MVRGNKGSQHQVIALERAILIKLSSISCIIPCLRIKSDFTKMQSTVNKTVPVVFLGLALVLGGVVLIGVVMLKPAKKVNIIKATVAELGRARLPR